MSAVTSEAPLAESLYCWSPMRGWVSVGLQLSPGDTLICEYERSSDLELLLSDHNADCKAPCHKMCPAHADVQGYVGAIANEAEIESQYIGHIEIYEDYSTQGMEMTAEEKVVALNQELDRFSI